MLLLKIFVLQLKSRALMILFRLCLRATAVQLVSVVPAWWRPAASRSRAWFKTSASFNSRRSHKRFGCTNGAECYAQSDEYVSRSTVLFITHRLGSLRHADQILVMDQGTLVEQGSHEELMALRGHYYTLFTQEVAFA